MKDENRSACDGLLPWEKFFTKGELLIHGDNLHVLSLLKDEPAIQKKTCLVYIDPPFGTKQNFTVTQFRVATISRQNGGSVAYQDTLTGGAYLDFMGERLRAIRNVMADDSSIYVHIDCKAGHYVKCLMDAVFGQKNFINDITRIKCNPKNFTRAGYGNTKDIILFYGKNRQRIWNNPRQAIKISSDDLRFNRINSDGRRYTTTPLHAPGETANGSTGKPWRGMFPPKGRHWRYPPAILEQLDKQGLIEWSSTGNPRKKIYADEVEKAGMKMQDVWVFKDPQNPVYPTEKNLDMLRLIIKASTNPGDIVLDAFCGSGTTLLAARQLGRRWIGIDSSSKAIAVAKERLPGCTVVDILFGGSLVK